MLLTMDNISSVMTCYTRSEGCSHNAATITLSPGLRSSEGDIFVSSAFLTSIVVYNNTKWYHF